MLLFIIVTFIALIFCGITQHPVLFNSDGFCQISRAIDVAAPEYCDVEGKQLHGNYSENTLKTVDGFGNLEATSSKGFCLLVAILADYNRPAIASRYLLKGIHAFLKENVQIFDHFVEFKRHSHFVDKEDLKNCILTT